MVEWNFSIESNLQKENFQIHNVNADTVNDALDKISTKKLEDILSELNDSQKNLNKNKKKKPKITFQANISTNSNFGNNFIDYGITLKNIDANSIPELIEKLKQINTKNIENQYKKILKEKQYNEMRHLPEESTLSASSFIELTKSDIEQILEKRKGKWLVWIKRKKILHVFIIGLNAKIVIQFTHVFLALIRE